MPRKIAKPINSMSKCRASWEWRPEAKDIPPLKFAPGKPSKKKKKSKAKKTERKKVCRLDNQRFYSSEQWRELRVRVLSKYGCSCMMCGRSPKTHGVVVHVDHIKPRSKYPELSLCFENLQVLCEDCNLGKGNKYETDYRPDNQDEIDEALDNELLSSGLAEWLA